MNDIESAVMAVCIALAVYGLAAIFIATPDESVVKACETRGYWQTGQTRIICHVEGK